MTAWHRSSPLRPGPRSFTPSHHMQPFQPSEHTIVAFCFDGAQWGEKGDFCGPPKVALAKAEAHLRAMVRAGGWPKGFWQLVPERGEAKEVRVVK